MPARGRPAMIAATGIVAIIAGAVGSAGPAMSQRTGQVALAGASTALATPAGAAGRPVALAYDCRFPSGAYRVGARVVVSSPATAVAGRAVRLTSLTLAVTVPATALSTLGPPGAAVTVTARLATSGVSASSGQHAGATAAGAVRAAWASLAAAPAPLPAPGHDLRSEPLRPTASLPALTAARSGTMTVTAAGLALLFNSASAKTSASVPSASAHPSASGSPSASASPGASASPSARDVASPGPVPTALAATCTLEPGQDGALATIAVRAAPASRAAASASGCPPQPKSGLRLNPKIALPRPPRGAYVAYQNPLDNPGCAWVVGYNDLRKSNSAAKLGPGLLNLGIGDRVVHLGNYYEEDTAGQFDYKPCSTCAYVHELPPAPATYLDFGFVPVSATIQLTEVGTMDIIGTGAGITLSSNTSYVYMVLRISNVKVNGQPLNVGKDCETDQPFLIELKGVISGPNAYTLGNGGALTGDVTIPPFSHCGVTENLDRLITGTVSGAGNYTLFTQGGLCSPYPPPPSGCPPPVPEPLR